MEDTLLPTVVLKRVSSYQENKAKSLFIKMIFICWIGPEMVWKLRRHRFLGDIEKLELSSKRKKLLEIWDAMTDKEK